MTYLYEALLREAAIQLAGEEQIDLFLYARIEDAGFDVNAVVDDAERLNNSSL